MNKKLPPLTINITAAPLELAEENRCIQAQATGAAGATVCFTGDVRGGEVLAMTLEHYPTMTEQALTDIARQAALRWPLLAVRITHRVGRMIPGEIIVFAAVRAVHRGDAFAACAYLMDYLKTSAPFWKKEETAAGARWVEARASDDEARKKWEQ